MDANYDYVTLDIRLPDDIPQLQRDRIHERYVNPEAIARAVERLLRAEVDGRFTVAIAIH